MWWSFDAAIAIAVFIYWTKMDLMKLLPSLGVSGGGETIVGMPTRRMPKRCWSLHL